MSGTQQVAIERAIARLERAGRLTAEAVVEAAKNPKSPLHNSFTWNVRQAAQKRWLDEARELIRSVKIEVRNTEFHVEIPRYVRDPAAAPEQGYVSVAQLRNEKDVARELLKSEFARASSSLARAKHLAIVLGLSDEIERIERAIISVSRKAA